MQGTQYTPADHTQFCYSRIQLPQFLCLQVGAPSIQDWQDDKQADCASSMLLPEKSTDGNIRLSTAQLTRATVNSQLSRLTDEPDRMPPKHKVTPQYVHLHLSLLVTVDLAATACSAALPGPACTITLLVDHVWHHSRCAYGSRYAALALVAATCMQIDSVRCIACNHTHPLGLRTPLKISRSSIFEAMHG